MTEPLFSQIHKSLQFISWIQHCFFNGSLLKK